MATSAETTGRLEWPFRALFGLLLAGFALGAIFAGGKVFAALVVVLAFATAREWYRLVGGARYAAPTVATCVATGASLLWTMLVPGSLWPVWILLFGGLITAILARMLHTSPLWNGIGSLYVGLPALSLVALRLQAQHGIAAVLLVFFTVWISDTGALTAGRLIGGPKLVPRLSPNKTWAGFLVGTVLSVLVVGLCLTLRGGRPWEAGLVVLTLALAGHSGDLFESWVKRRMGRKDSGGLIPGHGGVLDRLDSHPLCSATCCGSGVLFRFGPALWRPPLTTVPDDFLPSNVLNRRLTVLGSTGSIGLSTLDVVAHARTHYRSDAFPIEALTAHSNVDVLAEQARRFRPRLAVVADASCYASLKNALAGEGIETAAGKEGLLQAAGAQSDVVMVAIVGAAALEPTLVAAARGTTIALANKECVVAAGDLFRKSLAATRTTVVPVNSEHNAAFQLLDFAQSHAFERVTLTASGGPFREWPRERMAVATPEQAVAHPNWSMGAKISVDSATLMNKGLELIEAQVLFALEPEKLGVIIHPQSLVHCLVSYSDGSTLAHLSAPDMRTPIAHALSWPTRIASPSLRLDLARARQLTFEEPDLERFPCLALAQDCLAAGGFKPTILNAANEIAVAAFLERKIGFLDIASVIEDTLGSRHDGESANVVDLEGVLALDAEARRTANGFCRRRAA